MIHHGSPILQNSDHKRTHSSPGRQYNPGSTSPPPPTCTSQPLLAGPEARGRSSSFTRRGGRGRSARIPSSGMPPWASGGAYTLKSPGDHTGSLFTCSGSGTLQTPGAPGVSRHTQGSTPEGLRARQSRTSYVYCRLTGTRGMVARPAMDLSQKMFFLFPFVQVLHPKEEIIWL